MENNVVTLDTARKLKAAGFPQDTAFAWGHNTYDHNRIQLVYMAWAKPENRDVAAPTAQEIADQLMASREKITIELQSGMTPPVYVERNGAVEGGHTMAEALAALWLKLQEAK
jgi:hypothetical protein